MRTMDCDLTIPKYWDKHRVSIAETRGWEFSWDQDGEVECQTMKNYDRMMEKISPYLVEAISELTFFDLQRALEQVRCSRKVRPYSLSTMMGYRALLSDIYRFAQDRGDAYNILAYFTARGKNVLNDAAGSIVSMIDPALPEAVMLGRLRAALEERIYLPRSLRPEQQAHLIRLLVDRVQDDGRYCGLAIMLYAGLRPAECRALRWKDIVSFADYPERHMIYVHDSLDSKGNRKGRLKTGSGYRKVPVHIELEQHLEKRKTFVQTVVGDKYSIDDFPICCMENNFRTPCRDFQLSILAADVLNSLSVTKEELVTYLLDLVTENDVASEGAGDLHLASYVLRRNFWTWLQSSTQLTNLEKLYVMGHEMASGNVDLRPSYNNPEVLWRICCLMDKHAISLRLHKKCIEASLQKGQVISLENCGIVRIHIPKEQLVDGGVLNIRARTNECGDSVIVKAQSKIRPFGKLEVNGMVTNCERASRDAVGINCEYWNYQVLEGLRLRGKPRGK